ncbi:MAG: adenosine deaminase [Spirochaetota bacterium]
MKCFYRQYNDMIKTELHCHLEGSIRTSTIIDIAKEYNFKIPSYEVGILNQHVKVTEQLQDLASVLKAFEIAQRCFVSPAAVERIAYELFEDAAYQNIKLFELRFSPDWAFRSHALNWDRGLEGILKAKERAEKEFGMAIGVITISSRSLGRDSCEKTIDWTIKWKDFIQGIDLADGEAENPIEVFVKPVLKAKKTGLKVTVHSGEDTPASAVVETILSVCPDRIGHGIHIIDNMEAIELVKEKGITLEVNPWSNYLTKSVKRIEEHPLKRLYDRKVKTTINSDDPEVLDTNLNNEYRIAHEILGMSFEDIAACNRYAVEASFVLEEKKQRMMKKYFS